MKKIIFTVLLATVFILSGCMSIINPLSATVKPSTDTEPSPSVTVTPTPQYQLSVRAYSVDQQPNLYSIKCDFAASGEYVYRFYDELPQIYYGDEPQGFTAMPQDNIIKSDKCRKLAVAQLDGDGKILASAVFDYIPGVNYYTSDSPQYAALLCSVTNTDKQDYSYGYGELCGDYLSSTKDGVNAGINYYCHAHQPFYSPIAGKVIAVNSDSVSVYISEMDATLCVMHFSDTAPSQELLNTDIEAGTLLGYTGGAGLSGFPEMHMELLCGLQTNRAGYANPLETVTMVTYDVRILLDGAQAVRDESKPQYVPYSVNAGGNATAGLAARENGYIYFINSNDSGRIYRMKNDGTEQQKISNKRARFLTVCEGWVYYSSVSDGLRFYRSKIDGSADELVYKASMSNFIITGDRIFMENVAKSQRLYTLLMGDEESLAVISDNKVNSPFYYKGIIYSSAVRNNMQIYTTQQKVDQEGNLTFSYEKLGTVRATNIVVAEDKIFYANDRKAQKLYVAGLDGAEETLLADVTVSNINYYNGYLYFVNETDGSRIYRCRTDGSEFGAAVSDGYCGDLCIAGDWLFYNRNGNTSKTYRYNVITGEISTVKK